MCIKAAGRSALSLPGLLTCSDRLLNNKKPNKSIMQPRSKLKQNHSKSVGRLHSVRAFGGRQPTLTRQAGTIGKSVATKHR
eukprot:1569813-Pleurochrysis_carterae.AAC.1